MNLMDNMKDEELGIAILYNFTKAYGEVELEKYDLVLPLLYNDTFRNHVLETNNILDAIHIASNDDLLFRGQVSKNFDTYKETTSNALALSLLQGYITYKKVDGKNKGVALDAKILDILEAQHLAKLLKEVEVEEVMNHIKLSNQKIVVLQRDSVGLDVSLEALEGIGNVTYYANTLQDEVKERIKDADIVITNKNVIGKDELKESQVKLITLTATGFNNIDIDYCKENNIEVRNVKGYSTETVAQHTFTMALNLLEHIDTYNDYVKSTTYSKEGNFSYFNETFHDLSSLTWGIVGLGDIGRRVADIASCFGCKVIYYSTSGASPQEGYNQVDFDTLLKSSDIISIHCPLNAQTKDLFDVVALAKMKKDAILINVARGNIVDEEAITNAIKLHKLGGIGFDVFSKEPMDEDNPLLSLKDYKNVILTPHIAWASIEARQRCVQEVILNIEAYIKGEKRNSIV